MTGLPPLDLLAATLLPGDEHWPSAGSLGLGTTMTELAGGRPGQLAQLRDLLADPPDGLLAESAARREAAVRLLESERPGQFGLLRTLAYQAYYQHPRVQAVLAERTGLRPGPAQPLGYPAAFEIAGRPDTSAVLARGVRWRPDGTEVGARVRREQEADPSREWTEEEIWSWRR
jgi:hypothetical protein